MNLFTLERQLQFHIENPPPSNKIAAFSFSNFILTLFTPHEIPYLTCELLNSSKNLLKFVKQINCVFADISGQQLCAKCLSTPTAMTRITTSSTSLPFSEAETVLASSTWRHIAQVQLTNANDANNRNLPVTTSTNTANSLPADPSSEHYVLNRL